jgi:signal peptidase II
VLKRLLAQLPSDVRDKAFVLGRAFSIIFRLMIVDQLFKWWFISSLPDSPGRILRVTDFLEIVYVWNYGISFGMFKDYYQYSNYAFIVINAAIVLYLYSSTIKLRTMMSFWGYNLIIGGAVGNLIDRCYRGAVFDFICFHYEDLFWFPVFNLADSFIFIGVIVVLYDYYKVKKPVEQKMKNFYDDLAEQAELIRKADDDKLNINK